MNAKDQSLYPEFSRAPARVVHMYANPGPASQPPGTLICPCSEGWHVIPISEISHCTAQGNYVQIFFGQGQCVLAAKTLGAVEQLLPVHAFVKPHQSHLVAVREIRLVTNNKLILADTQHIPVSRTGRARVKEAVLRCGLKLE